MREVSKDSSSDRCFNLAENWLQNCQDNHVMCRAAQATSLPTRVIYLGKSDEELRLCITHGTSAKYATLSHCWGQITLPTLSMNNIQRLQLAIDYSVLPKSFQDAITVTRRLGVQYLWIDSLCIIQDSAQDWEQESAKMADIYINAWFTIAATGAHDARGGLFIPSEYRGQAVEIPCPGSAGEPNFIYARESRDQQNVAVDVAHRPHRATRNPLDGRAWALQERCLSTRTFFYTETELAWECLTGTQCECRSHFQRTHTSSSTLKKNFIAFRNLPYVNFSHARGHTDALKEEWKALVEDFTRRNLTKVTDRLPAFSGLAAQYEKATSMTYAFGLWKENFAHGLTWRVDRDDDDIFVNESQTSRSSKIYQNYYAPTWSWASVTDQITYPKYPGEALVEILDIHCVPASRNKYGPALEGRVELSGPVCEVRPRRLLKEREGSSPGCANVVHVVFEAVSVEDEHLSEYVASDIKGDTFEMNVDQLYILLLVHKHREGRGVGPFGILLQRICQNLLVYKRIGTVFPPKEDTLGQWLRVAKIRTIIII